MEEGSLKELRRRIRAPYRVRARLEIVGSTNSGKGWPVTTCDANEWGIRIASPKPVPRVSVLLRLPAPDGSELTARGWIIHMHQPELDLWEAGIEFEARQPLLSTARIDLANYGT